MLFKTIILAKTQSIPTSPGHDNWTVSRMAQIPGQKIKTFRGIGRININGSTGEFAAVPSGLSRATGQVHWGP